jgi:hypothetical protein
MNYDKILTDTKRKKVPENVDPKNLFLAVMVGVLTAIVFGLGGFFLLLDKTGSMGWVLFLLLPFATGFATALVSRRRTAIPASLLIGLIFCSAILLVMGAEGWVCVLMSAPLLAIGLTAGAFSGTLVRRYWIDKAKKSTVLTLLMLLVIPSFLMGANKAEQESRRTLRAETITDSLVLKQSPESVWNEIKSMDSVKGTKTLLMKIGLPVPVSCKTEGEGVGGKRTCYFESGYIEEKITEWNPPHTMKFEITASEVPGRPWLTFKDASYVIRRENDQTIVTRNTTIVSRLSPAWYWRRLEAFGVHTEHRYLFEAIENKLEGK